MISSITPSEFRGSAQICNSPLNSQYSVQVWCRVSKRAPRRIIDWVTGFISNLSPHKEFFGIPDVLPTLHSNSSVLSQVTMILIASRFVAVDNNDFIVPAARTIELQKACKTSVLKYHNEGLPQPLPVIRRDLTPPLQGIRSQFAEHGHRFSKLSL
jgi:hypothetical protein